MSEKTVVLITGVGDYWGGRLAASLIDNPELQVIGLDNAPPAEKIQGLDFIQADVRDPLLSELLVEENVDIVCHLKFIEVIEKNENVNALNVAGAKKVLAACAEAGVDHIILKSNTAVYGAYPDNSAFLEEGMPLRGSRSYGYINDLIEIELFCYGYRDQNPQTGLTILRFANIVGLTAETPMTQFLSQRAPRILLGFDPLLQIIHEDDVIEAMAHAVLNKVSGVFNVAADGPMPLSRILRLNRRRPTAIFHPFVYLGRRMAHSPFFQSECMSPLEWSYLRYSCVADLTSMREQLGFEPLYMADETLREYARRGRPDGSPDEVETKDDEGSGLRDIIERRRRMRARSGLSSQ